MSENKFQMKRVGLTCSLKCNLNCKLCVVRSPYHWNDKFPSVKEIAEYIRRYFNIVDYVDFFTISGGEPLLYSEFPSLLDELLHYIDKIGKLEIITNGTILPNKALLSAIRKYDRNSLKFIIDDYGENLSKRFSEITTLFENNNVPYIVNRYHTSDLHCGGWVNYGSAEKIIHTNQETIQLFSKCAYPTKFKFCFNIWEGKMVSCFQVQNRMILGHSVDECEYIDLMDDSLSIEEQRKKISYIYNMQYMETCAYCNGLCDDSERFKPAEQFTVEELQKIRGKDYV